MVAVEFLCNGTTETVDSELMSGEKSDLSRSYWF